jgi:hypothetical protein
MASRNSQSSCNQASDPSNHEPQPSLFHGIGDRPELETTFKDAPLISEAPKSPPEQLCVVPKPKVNALRCLT